jgi:DNA-binding beta-propeller fold protein YncE
MFIIGISGGRERQRWPEMLVAVAVCLLALAVLAASAARADTGIVANDLGIGPLGTPDPQDHAITEFDPTAFSVGPSITTTGGSNLPTAVVVSPDGTTAYVVDNGNSSSLSKINLAQGREVSNTSLGIAVLYEAISPDGKWVYASGGSVVVPINVADTPPRPQPQITVPGDYSTGDNEVAFSPDGSTAWVTSPSTGEVYPIDVATRTLGAGIPTGAGAGGVVVSPDGKTL